MDIIQILLAFGIAAGIGLVIFSYVGRKRDKGLIQDEPAGPGGYFIEKRLEAMDTTISEADNVISELGGMSRGVMQEMDKKYNELLFLYNLIDEKKKEISEQPDRRAGSEKDAAVPAAVSASPAVPELKNPMLPRIVELKNQGKNVSQIAKELNMGQGEVSLILSLTGR